MADGSYPNSVLDDAHAIDADTSRVANAQVDAAVSACPDIRPLSRVVTLINYL